MWWRGTRFIDQKLMLPTSDFMLGVRIVAGNLVHKKPQQ